MSNVPPPGMPGGLPGPVAPNGHPLATPGSRIAARLIDVVIGVLVGSVLGGILGASGGYTRYNFGVVILGIAVSFLLEAGLTATQGGSVGKLMLGLRVANASDGSSPVSWGPASIRWAIPGVFGLIPVLGWLASFVLFIASLVLLFSDPLRQTVSDKVARTLVLAKT